MDRKAFYAELEKLGTEYSPALIEVSNGLLAPIALQPDESRVTRDIAYGPHERHCFNLFRPVVGGAGARTEGGAEGGAVPCVIFVHDGGFVMGDKGAPGAPFNNNIGAWAQQQGFACATINYRLAPEIMWPEGREDVITALTHIASHAAEYGIDPSSLILMGHSAGATHVADVLANPGAAAGKIAGAIISAGFYDLANVVRDPFKPQYYGADLDDWSHMSALPGLLKTAVPCLFSVGELDMKECQDQAMALAIAWYAAKGRWPNMHVQAGHNHLTEARQIGSPLDTLGPIIAAFISSLA